MSPRLELLSGEHDIAAFRSGNQALDAWLHTHGWAAQQMDSARTFLLVDEADVVLGYFSLAMGSVRREDAPTRLVRGMPAHPIGLVLLARLAVQTDRQGRGLGGALLAGALRKAVAAGEAAAARLVVVDAINGAAAAFYTGHGFLAVPEHPHRLYRRMKDIRASLDASSLSTS